MTLLTVLLNEYYCILSIGMIYMIMLLLIVLLMQSDSVLKLYMLYRLGAAVFFTLTFSLIIENDFSPDWIIVQPATQIMHFAYWAYFVLMLDTILHCLCVILFMGRDEDKSSYSIISNLFV